MKIYIRKKRKFEELIGAVKEGGGKKRFPLKQEMKDEVLE